MLPDHQELSRLYAYPEPPPDRGWVRGCMITSLDGSAVGPDGLSGSLGTTADRLVMRLLRGLSDVVLVGAGTVRSEGYGLPDLYPEYVATRTLLGQPAATSLAIITTSGDIGDHLLDDPRLVPEEAWHRSQSPLIILTTQQADADAVARLRNRLGSESVVVCGEESVDPRRAVAALADLGLRRILCEGGPGALSRFAAASVVDELAVTISPRLVGGTGPRILHGPPLDLDLEPRQFLQDDDGTMLTLWQVTS